MEIVIIYDKATLEILGSPYVTSLMDFLENPSKFYPNWNTETMLYATSKITNPIVDETTGQLREMTDYEKAVAGITILGDGEYLDNENKEIIKLAQPNEYSAWDNDTKEWVEDNDLKKQYLINQRYSLQQKYLALKKQKAELEEELAEFEELGFDTEETENQISNVESEMKSITAELKTLNTQIKKL